MKLFRGIKKIQAVPENLNLGNIKTREIRGNLEKLKQQTTNQQRDSRDTIELLGNISKEYEQLQTAYYDILGLMAETLLRYELLLQSLGETHKVKERLEEMLKQHGVERFSPKVGDGIPRESCKVIGYYPTDTLFPGSVAKVISDGFQKDGRILVYPIVLECAAPKGKEPAQS